MPLKYHTQDYEKETGAGESRPRFFHKRSSFLSSRFLLALALVFGLGMLSLFIGAYDIMGQDDGWDMFFITRIPRTAALMLTGAALSISGLVMQLITQNRLVEPTTTGTIEWAGLGLILVYVLIPSPSLVERMTGAIIFSFIGTMVFFVILRRIRLQSSLVVPLVGIMLGAVVSALSTFVGLVFNMTQSLEVWFAGSFAPIQVGRYEYLWIILILTALVYVMADRLTVAGLGEAIATNLGLNYNRIILVATGIIALAVGIVAAVVGNLPFLGLIVPNIVSLARGDDVKSNLPWVALLGMGTLILCDIISRTIIAPFEVPVSLILGTFGAILFIFLLLQQRRRIS